MKNIILILLFAGLITLSGCYTLYGSAKPLVLVDAPKDIAVSKDGKDLKVHKVVAFFGGNNSMYLYPGVDVRYYDEKSSVDLKYGDKTVKVNLKTKPRKGGLIVEGILTLGIGYLIDVSFKSNWQCNDNFVDVQAYFNNTPPRNQKELKKIVWDEYLH